MAGENKRDKRRFRASACLLAIIVGTAFFSDCGRRPKRAKETPGPILLVGIDGLDWDVLLPLLKAGRLPNIAGLMERGYYGQLSTFTPTISPVIWTSVVTGKVPQKHGIKSYSRTGRNGKQTLFNNTDRITKALWDIVSDYQKTTLVVGWWMTFPVDPVNGVMVAQANAPARVRAPGGKDLWKGALFKGIDGQVHPPTRQDEMIEVLEEVEKELSSLTEKIFGRFPHPLTGLSKRLWNNCRWVFRADETYRRIALKLAQEKPLPDLTFLYIGGTDVVSHRFWRYMQPELYRHPPTPEEVANFSRVIESYYIYADQTLGELQKTYGPEATIIIASDHGFKPVNLEGTFGPDVSLAEINSAHHYGGQPGVFLAAGPQVRRSPLGKMPADLLRADLGTIGSVLDITPTILAMLSIPGGKDMDGKLLESIFLDDFRFADLPKPVATHDTPTFLARRGKKAAFDPGEEERLEQLRSLGYIGNENKDK